MLWINVQSLTAHKWHRSFRWRWWADNSWNNKWISIVMFWHSCCAYCVSYFLFYFVILGYDLSVVLPTFVLCFFWTTCIQLVSQSPENICHQLSTFHLPDWLVWIIVKLLCACLFLDFSVYHFWDFFPFFCPFQDLFSWILSFPCVLCVLCLGLASSENHHNYPFKYLLHKYTTKLLVLFFFMCINVPGCIHSMQKKHLLPVSDMDEF